MVIKNITKKKLLEQLKTLKITDDETRNKVVCSLIGHSLIQTACFGYFNCARCGEQVGDTLGGIYNADKVVIVNHNCPKCKSNFKKLNWKHKLYCPNPFKDE